MEVSSDPFRVAIDHSHKNGQILGATTDAHLDQLAETSGHARILGAVVIGREAVVGELEMARQPVQLAGVELERVDVVTATHRLELVDEPLGRVRVGRVESGAQALPPPL